MGRVKKSKQCPRCSSKDVLLQDSFDDGTALYVCADCDHEFEVGGSKLRNRASKHDSDGDFGRETAEESWEN